MEALARRGAALTALARSAPKAAPLRALGCRVVRGGLEDDAALAALVQGQDVVFHVAGLVAARSPAEFQRTNADATARLAHAAAQARGPRLGLVSSLAASGPSQPGRPAEEGDLPAPVTAYGRSKLAGERAARASGVPLTIVRPPAVYGPRDRAFLALFRWAAHGLVPLLGDGSQELTLVHARDLALALVAAAESPQALGRTYNAAHPTVVTQLELALAVGRAVGRPVRTLRLPSVVVRAVLAAAGTLTRAFGGAPLLDADKAQELLAPGWVASSHALERDAGWKAVIGLEEGLAETARHYREAGWLPSR